MNGGWYSSNSLLVSILMLFIVLDPIGNSPYFYILTRNYSSEARRKIISMSVSVAAFIMLFFAVLGDIIFELLDVTVDDFRIAAGIILLIYFIAILLEIDLGPKQVSEENIAVVPLAMPLLAGPAAISTVIYIKYVWGLEYALISTVVNLLLAYPILLAGNILAKYMGKNGSLVFEKLMAMIMAAFAVSMIREGLHLTD
ncbi:MAG: MarC family protein [Desulfurococcales archaeon]|nr:MarC family protein [Desulfurococcales archaeon]MEB3759080.1 MarC family protein [Desulfurococcales archaeon]MEB3772508.1 MarC family protein [Desulfurococcales archaeon]MEB3799104.1 MarC family protein [Desulfurococcales archaeon]MEB3845657.1 MarC family protein [Desulfurococcales archaeon]